MIKSVAIAALFFLRKTTFLAAAFYIKLKSKCDNFVKQVFIPRTKRGYILLILEITNAGLEKDVQAIFLITVK